MIARIDQFQTVLKRHGLSVTAPRKAVFTALSYGVPLTMAELALRCNDTDRATIYRTVATFESAGILRRVYSGWKYKVELSDLFDDHHHHATCEQCGATVELAEEPLIEREIERLAVKHHFAVSSHQIELRGRCEKCTAETLGII